MSKKEQRPQYERKALRYIMATRDVKYTTALREWEAMTDDEKVEVTTEAFLALKAKREQKKNDEETS